jgi:Mg2+ and Co2+ transporter CorA
LFINGVTEERLGPIATSLDVPEKALQGLFQSTVPRFDRLERFTTLFVRYPLPPETGARLRRTPVLLVGTTDNVVVLSREHTDLARRVERRLGGFDSTTPRMVRAMLALVSEILRAYGEVVERLEASLLRIEADQAALADATFLARTFELRADILRVRSSLKHLKSVARNLSRGQLSVAATDVSDWKPFGVLTDDAGDLYGSIEDVRDSLQALVDLRLNVSSFQMNRVMRLLALLTALALIPATAGGLLGMNLLDTPWPATLEQVSFGVAGGMALSLYLFAIKGWLR